MQRWQCKVCHGSTLPLPPDVTSRQRPHAFRELVADLYVHSVIFRGLSRILARLGCGVGAATLWRDVPGGGSRPDARPAGGPAGLGRGGRDLVVHRGRKAPRGRSPEPQGKRLDLRLSGPGFDWGGWFTDLAAHGAQGVTTDDDPVYGPALDASGLDRQLCAVHMQCTVGWHIRGIDEEALTHLDRVLFPSWHGWRGPALAGHPRLHQPPQGLVRPPQALGPPDAGLKTEARHFVGLMAGGMA